MLSDLRDFGRMVRGLPTIEQAKALSISLAPNGFVNEVQTRIVRGAGTTHGADTSALEATMAQE